MLPGVRRLRFGDCEIDLGSREVRLDGQPQPLPPKAYQLLLFLIHERRRVVPKSELIERIWLRKTVSDSVPARTVMQARRAIGDSARRPVYITNNHSFGYRFVGDVVECSEAHEPVVTSPQPQPQPEQAVAAPPQSGLASRVRLAVLPCHTATGDANLEWARFGLAAMTCTALQADGRFDPTPFAPVFDALARVPEAKPESWVQRLRVELDVQHVVCADLRRQGDMLWLDYRLYSGGATPRTGSLRDVEVAALADRLAGALADTVFAEQRRDWRAVTGDPFADQTFARAFECYRQQQWTSALRLFDVVCELKPQCLVARLWRLHLMSITCDPQAQAEGEALLSHPDADDGLRAAAHVCVGHAWQQAAGSGAAAHARRHLGRAEHLLEGQPGDGWATHSRLQLALDAYARGDAAFARQRLERVESDANRLRLSCLRAQALQCLGDIASMSGDLIGAKQQLEQSLQSHRKARRQAGAAAVLASLAELNAELGLMDLASTQASQALADIPPSCDPPAEAFILFTVAAVFAEVGASDGFEQVMARATRLADDARASVRAPLLAAQAMAAGCEGDGARANRLWDEVLALSEGADCVPLRRRWLLKRLHLALVGGASGGHLQIAADTRHRLAVLATHENDLEAQCAILHSLAAEQALRGETDAALAGFSAVLERAPLGRAHAFARIDAAWLLLARGCVSRATALLCGAGAWRHEHPAGLSCDARLQAALGRSVEAAELVGRARHAFRGAAPTWLDRLAQVCEHRLSEPDVQGLPLLPSMAWGSALNVSARNAMH